MIRRVLFTTGGWLGLLPAVAPVAGEEPAGVSRVQLLNYPDCVQLTNGETTVVLGHHVGGRVLSYRRGDVEALWLDPREADWEPGAEAGARRIASAGRFDIGPEYLVPRRPVLWEGGYSVEVTGDRAVRLTSADDPATGVRIVRDFVLSPAGSHLACTQTVVNTTADRTTRWCHWSRTFSRHGGVAVVPLTPDHARFPNGWVMVEGRSMLNMRPVDPNVRRRGEFLEITGPPTHPKMGFDSYAGWLAYVLPEDVAFVKSWDADPDDVYNELAGLTVSVWYPRADQVPACELEPIGPRQTLAPGERASFTEHWWLLDHPFPRDGARLDLDALAEEVAALKTPGSGH